jgi:hypothetical protein
MSKASESLHGAIGIVELLFSAVARGAFII